MPIYEYYCPDCDIRFEARRSMAESDRPISCIHCERARAHRVVSSFAAHGGNGGALSTSPSGACSSCSTKNCSTCG